MTSPAEYSPEKIQSILQERESTLREQWVTVYEARLIRQEMKKCYQTEGVNHYHACHDLVVRYLELLKDAKVKGFRKLGE